MINKKVNIFIDLIDIYNKLIADFKKIQYIIKIIWI